MVCFAGSGESHYYYLRHRRGIHLAPPEAAGDQKHSPEAMAQAWQAGQFELVESVPEDNGEGKASGHWLLQAKSPTEIGGTWTEPHSGKTLSIVLRKAAPVVSVGSPNADWGCEQAFYEPIAAGMNITSRTAAFAGHAYQKVSSEEATSLQVPAKWPHAQAFNRYAMEWLRNQSILAYDCNIGRRLGGAQHIDASLEPVLWTKQYLVLQDSMPEIYCGGAHGSSSLSYLTWSWSQGRLVNTWSWLQGGEKSLDLPATQKGVSIKSGLFRLIAKLHPRNVEGDECRDVLDVMSIEAPYPTARGLVFNTSFFHAARACNDQVTLDWRELMPYLSAEGRGLSKQFRE